MTADCCMRHSEYKLLACHDRGQCHVGEASARELKRLVQFRKVLCKRTGTDKYGRFLGACWAQPILWGGPVDLSAAMVASGHAEVYR